MKKKVSKSKSAKSAKMAKVKELREGFRTGTKKNPLPHVKHNNVAISDVSNEKYPEMVQITLGPAKIMDQIGGKRYVNLDFAIMAIDTAQADALISTGAKGIKKELLSVGINASTPTNKSIEQGGKIYLSKDASWASSYGVKSMLRAGTEKLYYSE